MRQILLDTETTGLSPAQGHRIIEIGCVEMINRRLTGETFHTYLQPNRKVDEGAMRVHGITDDFLKGKPHFADIVEEFKAFIKDTEIIIHNAPFDVGFIENEFRLLKDKNWKSLDQHCVIIDTLMMARQKHPGQRNNLDALCKRYSVDNKHRDKHGALLDAHLLSEVYLAMTGGQNALKLEESAPLPIRDNARSCEISSNQHQINNVPFIPASESELLAHEAMLDEIEAKQGIKTLWRSLESAT